MKVCLILFFYVFLISPIVSQSKNIYVDDLDINGNGTKNNPLTDIQTAISKANQGDTVFILPGVYQLQSKLRTSKNGSSEKRIVVSGIKNDALPIIKATGRVLEATNSFITFENLIFDGNYGEDDVIQINEGADYFHLKNCEVMHSARDGVQVNRSNNVIIEDCKIHHMLRSDFENQKDAHGICGVSMQNLNILNTEIYYVSGDCFQADPAREAPYWNNVTLENCKLWTGPLPDDAANWKKGQSPGENAIDTKTTGALSEKEYRAKLKLINCEVYGFTNNGYIGRRAGINLKDQVEVHIDGLKIYNCQIGFRLRGPHEFGGAHVFITNSVANNNEMTFRLEDNLEKLSIINSVFNNSLKNTYFYEAGGGVVKEGLVIEDCTFMYKNPEIKVNATNQIGRP